MARDLLSCRKFVDFLDRYIDKTLEAEVIAEIDRHIADCPACRDYMTTYRDTIRISRSLCGDGDDGPVPEEVPEELVAAILASWKKGEGEGATNQPTPPA